jgi:hypothetical protein
MDSEDRIEAVGPPFMGYSPSCPTGSLRFAFGSTLGTPEKNGAEEWAVKELFVLTLFLWSKTLGVTLIVAKAEGSRLDWHWKWREFILCTLFIQKLALSKYPSHVP